MARKQLVVLFLCSLVVWTAGNGLLPLMPIYASSVGASPLFTGYYLSFAYLTLVLGTVAAGWLSDALQDRKTPLVIAGVIAAPALWLTGRVTTIEQLGVLTGVYSLCAGMQLALLGILAGLFAEQSQRGRVFGILGATGPLGGLLGGLVTGPIVDGWGYARVFLVASLWLVLCPLCALFLQDRTMGRRGDAESQATQRVSVVGANMLLLLLASTTVGVANFVSIMGRSLSMNDLGFASTAISGTAAAGGAMSLIATPVVGWLSDRIGRRYLLGSCYLLLGAGLLVLRGSTSLWHFCASTGLVAMGAFAASGIGSALVTDLVSPEALGVNMGLFRAANWAGGIVGYAGTGFAIQAFGMSVTLSAGALLAVIAVLLLVPVREARRPRVVVAAPP